MKSRMSTIAVLLCAGVVLATAASSARVEPPRDLCDQDRPVHRQHGHLRLGRAGTHDKLNIVFNFLPLHEPGQGNQQIGPCEDVLYEVHIARGTGLLKDAVTYQIQFDTNPAPRVNPDNTAEPTHPGGRPRDPGPDLGKDADLHGHQDRGPAQEGARQRPAGLASQCRSADRPSRLQHSGTRSDAAHRSRATIPAIRPAARSAATTKRSPPASSMRSAPAASRAASGRGRRQTSTTSTRRASSTSSTWPAIPPRASSRSTVSASRSRARGSASRRRTSSPASTCSPSRSRFPTSKLTGTGSLPAHNGTPGDDTLLAIHVSESRRGTARPEQGALRERQRTWRHGPRRPQRAAALQRRPSSAFRTRRSTCAATRSTTSTTSAATS